MDNKISSAKYSYGLTKEPFASRKSNGDTVIVGGIGVEADRWARVLTRRAAHQLWFELTQLLFPEKSLKVTSLVETAPLRPITQPAVTTHLEIHPNSEAHIIDILGWVDEDAWWFRVDDNNARYLWAALDNALYPGGWEGNVTRRAKLN